MEYKAMFSKGKEYLSDVVDRYISTHDNKLTTHFREQECAITGDTRYKSLLNIPVGEKDGKQISIWASTKALNMYSPDEISDKVLYQLYSCLIGESSLNEKQKRIQSGTRLYTKSEILNLLPNWEYLELNKENGVHYLKDLEGKIAVLSTEEYSKYMHRPPTREEEKRKKEEKKYLHKLLGIKRSKR